MMTLWEVGIEGPIGRWALLGPPATELKLMAFTIRFPGPNIALVDASEAEVAPLRCLPGVEFVRHAEDAEVRQAHHYPPGHQLPSPSLLNQVAWRWMVRVARARAHVPR
jgi:hypothetical protein